MSVPVVLEHAALVPFPTANWQWDLDQPPLGWTGWILWLALSGRSELAFAGRTWHLGPGDALLMPLDARPCRQRGLSRTRQLIGYLHFQAPEDPLWREFPLRAIQTDGLFVQFFKHAVYSLWRSPAVSSDWLRICLDALEQERKPATGMRRHQQALDALIEDLHQHPERPWRVPAMAQSCGLSEAQFNRVFRERYKQTPGDYLLTLRMRVAQQLLDITDLPLAAIAARVGYANAFSFSRQFLASTGTRPTRKRGPGRVELGLDPPGLARGRVLA